MNRIGAALLVVLLAAGCATVMPPAVTAPLSQPGTSGMEWQYTPHSITLNDCHMSGIRGPFEFNDQAIGQFPWTKTGAIEEIGGTGDAFFSGQQTVENGCLAWVLLLVHPPSFRATMNGGSWCPDGVRSCAVQTEGQVVRLR